MAKTALPYLSDSVPIVVPQQGTPTSTFHIWWQILVDSINALWVAVAGTSTVKVDGGDASNAGTPYIAIDGGVA